MKITLNQHILSNGISTNENPIHFEISGQRNLQIIKAIQAPNVQTIDRGNLQTKVTFQVGRCHKSQQEAIQHMLVHASDIVNAHGTLQIDLEDKTSRRFVLESATLQRIQTHYKGNASYTTYEIYGGNLHVNG